MRELFGLRQTAVLLAICVMSPAWGHKFTHLDISGVPRNFVLGGVQQIQLRTEDTEIGDLGAVAP